VKEEKHTAYCSDCDEYLYRGPSFEEANHTAYLHWKNNYHNVKVS
jgi:hypothetical protein